MIDKLFGALVAAIVALGLGHTIATVYREKEKQRRWRDAVRRLKLGDSNAPS